MTPPDLHSKAVFTGTLGSTHIHTQIYIERSIRNASDRKAFLNGKPDLGQNRERESR